MREIKIEFLHVLTGPSCLLCKAGVERAKAGGSYAPSHLS